MRPRPFAARGLALVLAAATAVATATCSMGGGGGGGRSKRGSGGGGTTAPGGNTGGGSAGGGGSGGGGAVPPGPAPALVSAAYIDTNASGAVDQGDTVELGFDEDADISQLAPAALVLVSPTDSFGAGAYVLPGSTARLAIVALGAGASLALYGTYRPGVSPNASPAAVSLDLATAPSALKALVGGTPARPSRPVPILVPEAARAEFQGEHYRGTMMGPFYGELHAHTSYSDGKDTPYEAYQYGHTQGGFDFMAVTDHTELIQLVPSNWPREIQEADQTNVDGTFVTIVGFEWSHGIHNIATLTQVNHCNVFSTVRMDISKSMTIGGFYDELMKLPPGTFGKFNHPGLDGKTGAGITIRYNDWNDFHHDPRADLRMKLVRAEQSRDNDAAGYIPLLDHGWHVGPSSSEDNHSADWGTDSTRRTGTFAASLTRADLPRALREMRTFSTSDVDAWAWLKADAAAGSGGRDALWMGSTVHGSGEVPLRIEAGDAGGEGFALLELVSVGGTVVHTQALASATAVAVDLTVNPAGDAYFYGRLQQDDGGLLYTAPIFVDR